MLAFPAPCTTLSGTSTPAIAAFCSGVSVAVMSLPCASRYLNGWVDESAALTTGRSVRSTSVKVTFPVMVSRASLPVPTFSITVPPDVAIVGLSLVPVIVMVIGMKVTSLLASKLLSTRTM